jgi:HD-GYP domain-containing protein (c-di-GMP phosphodiesterase class II)
MKEIIEVSFRDLLFAIQTAKFYDSSHPIVKKAIEKAYQSIGNVLNVKKELIIGIIGEEIAFEKEILFDLSKIVKPAIAYFKERGIEKIIFNRGFQLAELEKFISFLIIPKEDMKNNSQDSLMLMGVRNIQVSKIEIDYDQAGQGSPQPLDKYGLDGKYFDNISQSLINILDREVIDGLALKVAVNNIIENLGTEYKQLLKLNTLKRYDLGTFSHLINVSVLSMYFSSKIGFSREVVLEIGLSALFHDIGKLYISRKIIKKPGQLNTAEFSSMESHTILGSALILQYIDTVGIMPAVVSFEHHLKYDLSGYPKLAFPKRPHIVSQIVSICDTYDALSERRSYKSDYPPNAIYNLMMRGKGTVYNPSLLDKFFQLVGVWPIGSIVSLSDKRIAVVVEENQDEISSPLVRIIYPQKEEKIVDLKNNDSGLKVEHYLNPWKEGKDFLHLI